MKYRILCTALALILIQSHGFAFTKKMTLEQCLETGLGKNPALKAAGFAVSAAGHGVKAARSDFLPSVSSAWSNNLLISESAHGPTETDYLDQEIRTFNISLIQILYAGSRILNTYQKAKIEKQVAQTEMALEKLELVYNIETTFYKLMKAREDVAAAAESVDRLTQSVKAARAFLKKELAPYVDVLQAQVDLADAKNQLSIAKNNLNRERAALFSLMDQPLDPDTEFSDHKYHILKKKPSYETSREYALKNRPDIKTLKFQLAIAKKEAEITMGRYLPMVKINAGYYDQDRDYDEDGTSLFSGPYNRDQRNRYWSAGLYATWDIFDGGRAWHIKKKYTAEEKKINALIKNAENIISTGIRKALYSMEEAREQISGSAGALAAAKEYYQREERRLQAGISTITSLLDAQDRLNRARGNKTRAILDYQLAKSELKLMTGKNFPI